MEEEISLQMESISGLSKIICCWNNVSIVCLLDLEGSTGREVHAQNKNNIRKKA